MAVSPLGNVIQVNQMTPVATSAQNTHNNRVDFQNMVAQSQMQEKDEKVIEVRPTEENQEVDPDREHQREEADRETKRAKKQAQEDQDQEQESGFSVHKLDIKV